MVYYIVVIIVNVDFLINDAVYPFMLRSKALTGGDITASTEIICLSHDHEIIAIDEYEIYTHPDESIVSACN